MFIKKGYLILFAAFFVAATISMMAAEWKFSRWLAQADFVHNYHGICNDGVGRPYADFVKHLRKLAESGDTNTLTRVLINADKRSGDIYEVWLADNRNAYKDSLTEILK